MEIEITHTVSCKSLSLVEMSAIKKVVGNIRTSDLATVYGLSEEERLAIEGVYDEIDYALDKVGYK